MPLFIRMIPVLFLPLLLCCVGSRQSVHIHELPNYDPNAPHKILFMDFTIRRAGVGKPEQVTLTNSIIGNGEMKELGETAHSPYQIQLVQYGTNNSSPKEIIFEHPLFRSIEIANTNGTFDRKLTSDQEGHFSTRLPYTNSLTKIELYSITPDQGMQKIYTLRIKP